jgi:hypothetical protein
MWQERQKLVCLERSRCSAAPKLTTINGKIKSARKASTLPARVAIIVGAVMTMPMNTIVITSNVSNNAIGTFPYASRRG